MGYLTGWMRRYDAIFTEQYPAPAKLQPYLTDAKTLAQKLLDDYKESTVSPQTQQIDEADKARDVRVDQVNTMVNAMLKMVSMPQMQQAAQKVKAGLDLYKPSSKAALRDESTQIQQWLQFIDEDVQQDQAIQTLGSYARHARHAGVVFRLIFRKNISRVALMWGIFRNFAGELKKDKSEFSNSKNGIKHAT